MPILRIVCFLFAIFPLSLHAQNINALQEVTGLDVNPGKLKMFVCTNVPKNNVAKKPLVVVLHGCTQSAVDVARLTGWNKLAAANDFYVLYPQQRFVNNVNNCFNWFNQVDINKGKGECESIYQMILYMQQHYDIDTNRIYITGLSAGAAMGVVMLATHPEKFKAGAVFAGGAYKLATDVFESVAVMAGSHKASTENLKQWVVKQNEGYKGAYPDLIIYHGKNDAIVDYSNAEVLIRQWAAVKNCDTIPDKVDTAFMNVEDLTRKVFYDSVSHPAITFYQVQNMGHRILVKPGESADEGGQTGAFGMDKNFHSTYQTAKDFNLLK